MAYRLHIKYHVRMTPIKTRRVTLTKSRLMQLVESNLIGTQQTPGVGPMLGWRWATVVDDGATSDQHWANDSCLLGTANEKCL